MKSERVVSCDISGVIWSESF